MARLEPAAAVNLRGFELVSADQALIFLSGSERLCAEMGIDYFADSLSARTEMLADRSSRETAIEEIDDEWNVTGARSAPVVHLLGVSCPTNVVLVITFIVIDSVEACSVRLRPEHKIEFLERAEVKRNTATAVVTPRRIIRTSTTALGALVRTIFWRLAQAVSRSQFAASVRANVAVVTSAACRFAVTQVATLHFDARSAVTDTFINVTALAYFTNDIAHGKASIASAILYRLRCQSRSDFTMETAAGTDRSITQAVRAHGFYRSAQTCAAPIGVVTVIAWIKRQYGETLEDLVGEIDKHNERENSGP